MVGGGPAGAAAAIVLARAGRTVTLVDKAVFPRDKCCGDGLTTGALRHLEALGLDPANVASWRIVSDVVVRSPSGRTVTFPLPRSAGVYAAVARRVDLDSAVLDLARAAGVTVLDGRTVVGVEAGDDRVNLEFDDGSAVTASYVIAADGMWSTVRKSLGVTDGPGYLGEWHAFRQYFSNITGAAADQLWVVFEPDLLPGYAWSFPLPDGRANVGFGIQRQVGEPTRSMKALWPDLLSRPHLRALLGEAAKPEATHKAWPIPARVDATALTAAGGRVLFVGDAARATDPMTGEGIGQALESGELAAHAVLAAGPCRPTDARHRYETAMHATLGIDHKLAALLSRALRHRKGARAAVRIAAQSDWTRRNFARWLFEDYPRAVLATPARWHRGMLTGPGAYGEENEPR